MNARDAERLALDFLNDADPESELAVRVVSEEDFGWVVSVYAKDGSLTAGNLPLVVDRDGSVHETRPKRTFQEIAEEYRRTRKKLAS